MTQDDDPRFVPPAPRSGSRLRLIVDVVDGELVIDTVIDSQAAIGESPWPS